MSGDLSLTQSLGGLRIANPDDESVSSPTTSPPPNRPAPPSSHSSNSTVTDNRRPDLLPALSHQSSSYGQGLGFQPDEYHLQTTNVSPTANQYPQPMPIQRLQQDSIGGRPLSHRSSSSTPLDYQAQQAAQYPPQPVGYSPQMRQQSGDIRPVSGMYSQHNASQSSGFSQASYSYRSDMGSAEGGGPALSRHGSVGGMRQGSGPIPMRDGSRVYRQPSQQMNGPLPPRRNSRRTRPPPGTNPEYENNGEGAYAGNGQMPRNAEEWRDKGAAVSTRQGTDPSGQPVQRLIKKGVKDFNFGRTLGEGSYSTVLAATDRQNLKEYAIKVLDKRHIIKEKKVKYVNIERDTLNRLTDHPGVVRLYYTFQDERSLYFVLDLASGGELLGVLKKLGSFDVECSRFYAAEILDSIAYMHSKGVIHRDLKPENVLLDRDMHVKITDFGTAKILNPESNPNGSNATGAETPGDPTDGMDNDRAVSFVGTAEYVSPELLRDKNACKSSDLWAFGCILFQLIAGRPPFKAANEYLTFQKILGLEYTFPDGFPDVARDLVERLLVLEPANRLPVEHIRNHRFFEGTQWGKNLWRQKAPRLKAYVPPPAAPIMLGTPGNGIPFGQISSGPSPTSTQSPQTQSQASRPQLRGITELPPPSQLDIDWSPVLTHNNERILKLGNLIVNSSSQASSPGGKNADSATPTEKPKFSRFFSGSTTKKKERLVLITSNARVILAPAGGNEKKIKMEIPLVSPGCSWKSYVDSRGLTAWSIDTVSLFHHSPDHSSSLTAQPTNTSTPVARQTPHLRRPPRHNLRPSRQQIQHAGMARLRRASARDRPLPVGLKFIRRRCEWNEHGRHGYEFRHEYGQSGGISGRRCCDAHVWAEYGRAFWAADAAEGEG
jgi:3-phosphoinositide dependent protein kinase-1